MAVWTRRWLAEDVAASAAAWFRVSCSSLYTASADDLASAIDRNLALWPGQESFLIEHLALRPCQESLLIEHLALWPCQESLLTESSPVIGMSAKSTCSWLSWIVGGGELVELLQHLLPHLCALCGAHLGDDAHAVLGIGLGSAGVPPLWRVRLSAQVAE